ncbi:MAG TPA: CSLREA domain-containing protein, partial [Anaerolineae bacterium]|nr:CSLREA domain-containing protein [Anaerolineae bacterium]
MRNTIVSHAFQVRLLIIMILAFSLSLIAASQVSRAASSIVVTTTSDVVKSDGLCSLREAITAANKDRASSTRAGECSAGSGSDTIVLPAGTYTLAGSGHDDDLCFDGDLDITSNLVISPTGPVTITAASGFSDRIFQIIGGNVTILNVTISKGNVSGNGGGIYVNSGASLTLKNSTLTNNTATNNGGAIYNAGTLNLVNVTISGNKTTRSGSSYGGGGIYNASGTATLTNVTVSNNSGSNGGNLRRAGGTLAVKNTLVATATAGSNCVGTLTSQGFNLSSDTSCASSFNQASDFNNTNPQLGSLQDNGGWTFTQALGQTSPAVDHGTNTGCPATDQRGLPRPIGLSCDIGSYENQDPLQHGPIFNVNKSGDVDDGACTYLDCKLREAINAANTQPNGSTPDQIQFNLPGSGPYTIYLSNTLPAITSPTILDGSTQPGGALTIDGSTATAGSDCFVINGNGSLLKNLTIRNCPAAGIRVLGGVGNTLSHNSLYNNGALGIDLGTDGVTANDAGDLDTGPNNLQNFPVLLN